MFRPRPRLRLLLFLAIALAPPTMAADGTTRIAQAGVAAYEAGHHDEAARLFERAARAGNRLAPNTPNAEITRANGSASGRRSPGSLWRRFR